MTKYKDQSNSKYLYSDGDSETMILRYFENKLSPEEIKEFKTNIESKWAYMYHLSADRTNLLSWYPFKSNSSLLEVGAGCGALTGMFCEKLKSVTAIELTQIRSRIIKARYNNLHNLEIIAGNINEIEIDQKYDYATLIGVLEYAGQYESENPHLELLKKTRERLKPQGRLLLAIENKFGLKYWAGCKEDHTGRLFDSIEGYPDSKIRTFSNKELRDLLIASGYNGIKFYYPLPDYKFPLEIFSDDYLPNTNHSANNTLFPFKDLSQERYFLFDERKAIKNIINNDMFGFFANSFLVEAINK